MGAKLYRADLVGEPISLSGECYGSHPLPIGKHESAHLFSREAFHVDIVGNGQEYSPEKEPSAEP